jgi:hypothetical protein
MTGKRLKPVKTYLDEEMLNKFKKLAEHFGTTGETEALRAIINTAYRYIFEEQTQIEKLRSDLTLQIEQLRAQVNRLMHLRRKSSSQQS